MGRRRAGRWRRLALGLGLLAIAALPARSGPAGDPAQSLLQDGFETGDFAVGGGLFYKDGIEQRAGRLSFRNVDGQSGTGAVTLSVTPTCGSNTDDCAERAEVWERPEVLAGFDQTLWYGLSVHLDDPVPQDDARYVVMQWKREALSGGDGDYSPFMALRLYQGHLGVTVETGLVAAYPIGGPDRPDGCRPGEALVLSRPIVGQTRALVAMEEGTTRANYPGYFDSCTSAITVTRHGDLPSGQKGWIDFVFRSSPGPNGRGHVEIFADGRRVATVRGRIGHDGPGFDKNQYFKFGPYRAPNTLPWSVSYDNFRRGPRCADVMRGGQCPLE